MRKIVVFGTLTAILLAAIGATAQTMNTFSAAEIQGRQLAQKLLDERPAENFTNTGVLQIRNKEGSTTNVPMKCEVIVTKTNWENLFIFGRDAYSFSPMYFLTNSSHHIETLDITHFDDLPNRYSHASIDSMWKAAVDLPVDGRAPLANSDFWGIDFGLEFLHWPEQKILRGDTARGRLCKVLESTNPNPSTNGYSRVDSWIDNETLGIVEAKAYDWQGKLLKEFYPKDIKKVDGQWQVESMEIDNVQTGSRTRLEFGLKEQ